MRKALVYIFFLGMLLNTCLAHALALPHAAITAAGIQKENYENKHDTNSNDGYSQISKDLLISDWDEYDECDHDDQTTSVNKKEYQDTFFSVKNNVLTADFISKTYCDKIYTSVNFSRLPRYNYISLRVLRI